MPQTHPALRGSLACVPCQAAAAMCLLPAMPSIGGACAELACRMRWLLLQVSVLAMTSSEEGSRETLKYKLQVGGSAWRCVACSGVCHVAAW